MGHADVKTTMRYLHHKSQASEAALIADAFKPQAPAGVVQAFELATAPEGV
jgi:hypothetical protein